MAVKDSLHLKNLLNLRYILYSVGFNVLTIKLLHAQLMLWPYQVVIVLRVVSLK